MRNVVRMGGNDKRIYNFSPEFSIGKLASQTWMYVRKCHKIQYIVSDWIELAYNSAQ